MPYLNELQTCTVNGNQLALAVQHWIAAMCVVCIQAYACQPTGHVLSLFAQHCMLLLGMCHLIVTSLVIIGCGQGFVCVCKTTLAGFCGNGQPLACMHICRLVLSAEHPAEL